MKTRSGLRFNLDAAAIASELPGISADECFMFGDIMDFLWDVPSMLANPRGRAPRPNILLREGVKSVAGRWYRGRRPKVSVNPVKTMVDPAVVEILRTAKGSDFGRIAQGLVWHNDAMSAENATGILLEMYIAQEMEKHGWIWCSGEIVKSVDFLKRTDDGYIPLQVKNRSNSENSSSAAVRAGTDIIKWHRINAMTGKTYWDKFPEITVRGALTESGFQLFIRQNLCKN